VMNCNHFEKKPQKIQGYTPTYYYYYTGIHYLNEQEGLHSAPGRGFELGAPGPSGPCASAFECRRGWIATRHRRAAGAIGGAGGAGSAHSVSWLARTPGHRADREESLSQRARARA